MSVKYHISPATGRPNICKADKKPCPLGEDKPHFDTKEAAREHYEKTQSANLITTLKKESPPKTSKVYGMSKEEVNDHIVEILETLSFNKNDLYNRQEWDDPIVYGVKNIFANDADLDENSKKNLVIFEDLAKNLRDNNIDNAIALLKNMKYNKLPQIVSSYNKLDFSRELAEMSQSLIVKHYYDNKPKPEKTVFYETPKNLTNFDDSMAEVYNIGLYGKNNESFTDFKEAVSEVRFNAEPDKTLIDKIGNRIVENNIHIIPGRDKSLLLLDKTNDQVFDQKLYLSSVFPVKTLQPLLEEYNIDNVNVSSFNNGREYGLVYTVDTPSGDTRSFSVYEHRNSDSIIINGKTNWDKNEELPYAADDKYTYFAEISYKDFHQAADTLTFLLKEAKNGELDDDHTLASKTEHLDHRARLSEIIPGFKEWADNKYGKRTNEDDDPLSRIKM